jgi:hypothetical protein
MCRGPWWGQLCTRPRADFQVRLFPRLTSEDDATPRSHTCALPHGVRELECGEIVRPHVADLEDVARDLLKTAPCGRNDPLLLMDTRSNASCMSIAFLQLSSTLASLSGMSHMYGMLFLNGKYHAKHASNESSALISVCTLEPNKDLADDGQLLLVGGGLHHRGDVRNLRPLSQQAIRGNEAIAYSRRRS